MVARGDPEAAVRETPVGWVDAAASVQFAPWSDETNLPAETSWVTWVIFTGNGFGFVTDTTASALPPG
jgi:hypothetical protein